MKELSLHILDITQNSIRAGATLVTLTVEEDTSEDRLIIVIEDDGCGIPEEKLADITNPFVTSRTTRKVGMGLSLFKAAANACEGDLEITSQVGVGTTVRTWFRHSHIDRAPLGNMGETVVTMLLSFNDADLLYRHVVDDREFVFDTKEIKEMLEESSLVSDIDVLNWIRDYVNESLEELKMPEADQSEE